MNLDKNTQSSLMKDYMSDNKNIDPRQTMTGTGSTYYNDTTIIRKPENVL